jgi:acetylornithine deacetylase/succinyl-diaminopimelate desuccinylase family protein
MWAGFGIVSALYRRERAADDELEAETVSLLRELVRTPSVNPPGDYDAVVELLVDAYESFGWDVTVDHAPDDLLDARDLDRPRPNVLATVTEGEGPTVALNAHFDTVPVEDAAWTRDPFGAEIEDGRLYGRGATDSKGRIASYTLAARALEAADLLPEDATLVLAVTADEETGGHAGAGHVVDAALRPDYAIVEGSSEEIWHAGCGVLHFRVTVEGEAAHAGTPEDGENAVLAANGIVASLADHAADLADRESAVEGVDGPTCTPSTIEGGRKTNVVPAYCAFTVDRRVPPDEDPEAAEREFRDVVAAAAGDADVTVERVLRARPYRFGADDAHVRALQRSAESLLDREVPVEGTQGFTDARFFAAAGANCAHYGPGDEESNAHGPDESVAIDQVLDAGAVVATAVRELTAYS